MQRSRSSSPRSDRQALSLPQISPFGKIDNQVNDDNQANRAGPSRLPFRPDSSTPKPSLSASSSLALANLLHDAPGDTGETSSTARRRVSRSSRSPNIAGQSSTRARESPTSTHKVESQINTIPRPRKRSDTRLSEHRASYQGRQKSRTDQISAHHYPRQDTRAPILPPPFDPRQANPTSLHVHHYRDVYVSPEHYLPPAPPPEAWFSVGEPPYRSRAGWTPDMHEGFIAGWEDALRSVEAGVLGIGDQRFSRPRFLRNPLPATAPVPPGLIPPASEIQVRPPVQHSLPPMGEAQAQSLYRHPDLQAVSDSDPFAHHRPYTARNPSYTHSREVQTLHGPGQGTNLGTPPPSRPGLPHHFPPSSSVPSSYSRPQSSFGVTTNQLQLRPLTASSMAPSLSPTSPTSTLSRHLTEEGGARLRQTISCYPCRSRKLKCDGNTPCGQCLRRGGDEVCEYAKSIRRRGKGKKQRSREVSEVRGENLGHSRSQSSSMSEGDLAVIRDEDS